MPTPPPPPNPNSYTHTHIDLLIGKADDTSFQITCKNIMEIFKVSKGLWTEISFFWSHINLS